METARNSFGFIYNKNYLYIIGGYNDEGLATNSCEKFNILTRSWESMASLPHPAAE